MKAEGIDLTTCFMHKDIHVPYIPQDIRAIKEAGPQEGDAGK
jgi:hypothetical protein